MRDHWEYTSLKGDPNQTGNLHYGLFGDRYFKQLPYRVYGLGFRGLRLFRVFRVVGELEKTMEVTILLRI